MSLRVWIPMLALAGSTVLAFIPLWQARAGTGASASGYKVLPSIRQDNLTVFPVVAATSHDTQQFQTLDEGLRSGDVIVSEAGSVQPLIRRRWTPPAGDSAQVNRLVLVNNGKRPLILLAGEIVTGGKQDRVIGKDRLVPAESDPIDLSVFCVEPGRWAGSSAKFGAVGGPMAQPTVRAKAMADKDQAKVWDEVRSAQASVAGSLAAPARAAVGETTSYARVMENVEVKQRVDSVAAPIEREYRSLIQQLRDRNAVGVVVAVNGEVIWADIFGSTDLLAKYWPKLARSYAAEAIVRPAKAKNADEASAQAFVDHMDGRHQTVESEPGLYRHTEIDGDGFKAFELTSLLPKTGFNLHVAKMAE
ncbi:MAG TPA: DUF6569 family protein, partial [Terriglobales bacterium]